MSSLRAKRGGAASTVVVVWAIVAGGISSLATAAPSTETLERRPHGSASIDRSGAVQTGAASYYGKPGQAATTASGGQMDSNRLTAASRTLPLGTKAEVINKDNGRSTAVTITDRGPYARNRILDVSRRAADQLGMTNEGVSKVQVVPVHEPARANSAAGR